jgi:hypothetical protein
MDLPPQRRKLVGCVTAIKPDDATVRAFRRWPFSTTNRDSPRVPLSKRSPVISGSTPNRLTIHLDDNGAEHIGKWAAPPERPANAPPHVGTSEHVCLVQRM